MQVPRDASESLTVPFETNDSVTIVNENELWVPCNCCQIAANARKTLSKATQGFPCPPLKPLISSQLATKMNSAHAKISCEYMSEPREVLRSLLPLYPITIHPANLNDCSCYQNLPGRPHDACSLPRRRERVQITSQSPGPWARKDITRIRVRTPANPQVLPATEQQSN